MQVEIHDLEGLIAPDVRHVLRRMESPAAGARDVLFRRIKDAFEGRRRVWEWYIGYNAHFPGGRFRF